MSVQIITYGRGGESTKRHTYLIPLKEYNDTVLSHYTNQKQSLKTGIECPNCKCELNFYNEGVVLLSNPPKKEVVCFDCNYRGYVYC